MAGRPKVTCLVTIHGVGFQVPADDDNNVPGYADDLHRALKAYLPDGYLSDDPNRKISGAIYVRSDPSGGNDRAEGLKRLGTHRYDGTTDPAGAPLVKEGQDGVRLAHVALVYCNSEDWKHLHRASAIDGLVRAAAASGRYLSIVTLPAWLLRIVAGFRLRSSERPSLQRRSGFATPPSSGSSGLATVLWGIINDVCAYICENDLRTRVRGFVWEALVRLAGRDDVGAIIVNAHSQGTVVVLDALADLEPDVGQNVLAMITAGSPLRKYVDLFAWGCRLNRPAPLPWQQNWINFWDPADPVADPLRPSARWKAGSDPNPAGPQETLFAALDPNWGNALPIWITDIEVSNTKWSKGGGLQAHNYFDNVQQYIPKVGDFLIDIVSRSPVALTAPVEGGKTMSDNNKQASVQFPAKAMKSDGDDLSQPVVDLLKNLNILAPSGDLVDAGKTSSAFTGPPQSVAIIEAGATSLGKWWATTLGAGAGLAGIIAAFKGIWSSEHDPVRIAIIGGAAVLLGAVALSIGIIVSSDVRSRASGSVAEYQARAQVATTFLSLSRPVAQLAAGQSTSTMAAFRVLQDAKGAAQLQLKVDNDWVPLQEVQVVSPKP